MNVAVSTQEHETMFSNNTPIYGMTEYSMHDLYKMPTMMTSMQLDCRSLLRPYKC